MNFRRSSFRTGIRTAAAAMSGLALVAWTAAAPRAAAAELTFEPVRLVNSLNEGCAVADVNKDGQLDVIAGPNWYEGPTWRQHPLRVVPESGGEFVSNNSDHAIDLNGDGWVDVISASWMSPDVLWYQNPGPDGLRQGALWAGHKIIGGKTQCEGTILEDLDGDGVPEFVLNHWDAKHPVLVLRITPGKNGSAPKFTPFEVAAKGNDHGMAVGDVNGDGAKDVVYGYGWYEAPTPKPFEGKWKLHKAFDIGHLSVPGVVADVNGDGKNDVLFGFAHDYGVFWFEQGPVEKGEITWTKHLIDKSWSQAHCLVWADLDGDGKGELITGKRVRGHGGNDPGGKEPACLQRYVWNAGASKFDKQTISFDKGVGTGMQIRVADVDKDKRPDIVVAGKTGTWVLYNRGPAEVTDAPQAEKKTQRLSRLRVR